MRRNERTHVLRDHLNLLGAFVHHRLPAKDFESMYLRMFKGDPTIRPSAGYEILNGLFATVDAFCGDPIAVPGALDEEVFRAEAKSALAALRALSSPAEGLASME